MCVRACLTWTGLLQYFTKFNSTASRDLKCFSCLILHQEAITLLLSNQVLVKKTKKKMLEVFGASFTFTRSFL